MAAFAPTAEPIPSYPVRLSMQYPDRMSRLSTFFRVILGIPILFFLYLLQSNVTVGIWAAVLVKGRIPRWLFDFQVGLNRFIARAASYFLLLTDQYPAFEGDWILKYDVDYPDRISRWRLLFWKLITSLPHFVVLAFLWIAVEFVVIIGWFAILFTGSFPRGLHRFVLGVLRWTARVNAYVESLTDAFPPFSLEEDAGPGADSTAAICAVIGGILLAALIAGGIAAGIAIYKFTNDAKTVTVSYAAALDGSLSAASSTVRMDNVVFDLDNGADPTTVEVIRARPGSHLVELTVGYDNLRVLRSGTNDVESSTIRLETRDGGTLRPVLLTADGFAAPARVQHGTRVSLRAIFEVKDGDSVEGLRAYPVTTTNRHIVWKFR